MAKKGSGALQFLRGRRLISSAFALDPTQNCVFFDDFTGDTFSTDLWTTAADTGCTAAAINVAVGGEAKMLTDTTDDDRVDMGGAKIWKPSVGQIYAEARIKMTTITTVGVNFGMIDASTEASQVLAFAYATTTWTTTPVDGVAWARDTDGTDPDIWQGIGVKNNTDTAAVAGDAPTAGAYDKLGILISTSGAASFYQNDVLKGTVANATTATTLLAPYIGLINRSGAAHDVFVDYVFIAQALNR